MLSFKTISLQEVSEPNRASIYRSLTINISKEMMCYSDFPIPSDYPNYMHHSKILNYFRMYADHFKLLKYIRFQVIKTKRSRMREKHILQNCFGDIWQISENLNRPTLLFFRP